MNYFTGDYWWVSGRSDLKFVENTKFPFIRMTVRRQAREFLLISLDKWDQQPQSLSKPFHYRRLTKDKYEEILYSFLESDKGKHIIFNYLFNGKW